MIIDAVIQVRLKDKEFLLADCCQGRSIIALQCECLRALKFVRDMYLLLPEGEQSIERDEYFTQLGVLCVYGSDENITERYETFLDVSDCDAFVRLTGDAVCLSKDAMTKSYELFCAQKADLVRPWGYPQGICGEIISRTALAEVLRVSKPSSHPLYYMLEHEHEFKIAKNEAPSALFRPDIDVRVQCADDRVFARDQYQAFISEGLDSVIDTYDERVANQIVSVYQALFHYSGEEKNVLFLTHSPNMGGSEFSLLSLVSELHNEYKVFVGVGGEGGNVTPHLQQRDITTIRMDVPLHDRITDYSAVEIASITQVLRDHAIGMIYANSRYALMLAGLVARMDTDIVVVAHVRDILTPQEVWQMRLDLFDQVFVNSQAVKNILVDCGIDAKPLIVMYNWVDPAVFFPDHELRKAYSQKKRTMRIGYAGQLVKWKGIEDLITALGYLKVDGYDFVCSIAGDSLDDRSTYKEYIRAMIAGKGLQENVQVCGFVEDMNQFYNSIDVLVVPSYREPFGRVVMEAMAVGVTVIGTRCGGIPEMIKDNEDGILVDAYDSCQIAQALIRCYDQDVRVQLGNAARKKITTLFNKERLIKEWRESLQGVCVS